MFDAKAVKDDIVRWIRLWFDINGKDCNAVIGISGGTDSSVVAALLVEALGKDRVYGVLMPNGVQSDIQDAKDLVEFLDINYSIIDIYDSVVAITNEVIEGAGTMSSQAHINLPPRIRMATLYAVSQSMNGRVANTCNLSEDWVGYSTRWGDSVGDFSPLAHITKTEVKEIGKVLGLPDHLVNKTPSDGLCGKSDEDNLGFTYDVLDKYIRIGEIEDLDIKAKIDDLHIKNIFKLLPMPSYHLLPTFKLSTIDFGLAWNEPEE